MTAGFTLKKIELSKPESASSNRAVVRKDQKTALLSSMKRNSAHHTAPRKKLIKGLGITAVILVVLLLIIVIGIMLPMRSILVQARETAALAKETMAAAESQNIAATGEKLTALKDSLAKLENSYQKTGWIGFVPIVGAYYKDGENGLKAASEFIEAGLIAVDAITPYADLLGLKEGGTSFVDQPADKRIETAVKTFDKVTPRLGEIGEHLANAKESIDVIDPSRYPVKVGNKEIRPKIRKAKDMADQTIGVFLNAQPFLESLPRFLGEPDPKRYLILFQNDKELRATGGFLTAYALFRIEHGKIIVEKSEDIYKLDERQKRRLPAPSEIEKYHKGVTYAYIRDSNLSPDFYESMRTFDELMKNVSDPEQYDGIIAVDTYVLVEAMRVLDGEVFIPEYGTKFTITPDERCDGCPQVVYELEEFADQAVGYIREDRKDILGRLMVSLMQKALGVSPSQYWGSLTQMFFQQVNEKHILAYMHDEKAQQAIESLNFAGRILPYERDYLHISDVNFAGAKSNMYTKHYVTQKIEIGKDGTITKTIAIDYKNPSQPSNCSLEGGLCLNGLLRNWLRVYVPKGSKLISTTGADEEGIQPTTKEELEKTVFEGFLTVRPLGAAHVELKYELPFKAEANRYTMLIQKQPGTGGHEYTIVINDREVDKFNLTTDREVEYKI